MFKQISSRPLPVISIVLFSAAVLASVAILEGGGSWIAHNGASLQRGPTQPLRLQVTTPSGFSKFLQALRIHHYRAKHRSSAEYRDVYFDTSSLDLYQNGYSYRFRAAQRSSNSSRFSVRLEQEPRFVEEGSSKIELVSKLSDSRGDTITNGNWDDAVSPGETIAAAKRLREILEELNLQPEALRPIIKAELRRARFDVTDKGRNWFEVDHEEWIFRNVEGEPQSEDKMEDIVIDTRLSKDDPELLRRVRTMTELTKMINGIRGTDQAPHERGIRAVILKARSESFGNAGGVMVGIED